MGPGEEPRLWKLRERRRSRSVRGTPWARAESPGDGIGRIELGPVATALSF